MEFNFDNDMANQNAVSMQQLLNTPGAQTAQQHQMQWTASSNPAPQDGLSAMQVSDQRPPLPLQKQQFAPQPMHPQDMRHPQQQQQHHMMAQDVKPPIHRSPDLPPGEAFPQVDLETAIQMGGLRYADLRKEQAREFFKEKKKSEHLAKGEFDRMKRRKKGDTSMTAREKYVRRLKMNQDSAAAARYAQEEYVSVLEKLVTRTEIELTHVRQQNAILQKKVSDLQASQDENRQLELASFLEDPSRYRRFDPLALNKYLDMVTSPAPVSAQDNDPNFAAGNMGIQPTPAS